MNIVLTGATGFIGRHLIELLIGEGAHVRVVSRKNDVSIQGCVIYHGNISDKSSVEKAFTGADIVINLAAELRNEDDFQATNIKGVQNLCELANQYQLKRVVHLSSVGVQGMQFSLKDILINEKFPCHPKNGYEKSKLESEKIWLSKLDKSISLCILRPTNVFGDHHPRKALLGMIRHVKNGRTFYMDRNAKANYVYVKDLAYVINHFACFSKGESRAVYNVGEYMLLEKLVRYIAKRLAVEPKIKYLPSWTYPPLGAGIALFKNKKPKVQALFNKVMYDDSALLKEVKYPYGTLKGIDLTIDYYQNQKMLE